MILGALERFGGYTYTSLMAEDPELFRLLTIESLGRPEQKQGES